MQVLNQLSEHNLFPGSRVRPDSSRTTCNGFGPLNGVNQPQSPHNISQTTHNIQQLSDKDHTTDENFERFFIHVLTKLNSTIELNERRMADQDERERIKLEWQHVARVVDRILLTVFMVVTLTFTSAIMFQSEG